MLVSFDMGNYEGIKVNWQVGKEVTNSTMTFRCNLVLWSYVEKKLEDPRESAIINILWYQFIHPEALLWLDEIGEAMSYWFCRCCLVGEMWGLRKDLHMCEKDIMDMTTALTLEWEKWKKNMAQKNPRKLKLETRTLWMWGSISSDLGILLSDYEESNWTYRSPWTPSLTWQLTSLPTSTSFLQMTNPKIWMIL